MDNSWTSIQYFAPPNFHQLDHVSQWQELQNNQINQKSLGTKKDVVNGPLIQNINWVTVSSSGSWGSGVPFNGNMKIILEEKHEEDDGEESEDTIQNNLSLIEGVSQEDDEELTKQDLYKTEPCENWDENGTCRYGEKCQFAHGPEELRTLYRHPKYKTKICKTFHSFGICPYGKRCCFVHYSPKENSPRKLEKKSKKKSKVQQEKEYSTENKTEINTETCLEGKKNGSKLPFFQKLHKQPKKKS